MKATSHTSSTLSPDARAAVRDLTETLGELETRLVPEELLADVTESFKRTVSDARGLLSGQGLPSDPPRRWRTITVLTAAGGLALLVLSKALRRH